MFISLTLGSKGFDQSSLSVCVCVSVQSCQSFCGKDEGFCGEDEGFCGEDEGFCGEDEGFFIFLRLCQKSFVFTTVSEHVQTY